MNYSSTDQERAQTGSTAQRAVPGYFTPQTQNSSTSASTDNARVGVARTVSQPSAPVDNSRGANSSRTDRSDIKTNEDGADRERMGKRREALNKAQTAKKAASRADRKERPAFKEDRNSQRED
jgi:hypothetical protein